MKCLAYEYNGRRYACISTHSGEGGLLSDGANDEILMPTMMAESQAFLSPGLREDFTRVVSVNTYNVLPYFKDDRALERLDVFAKSRLS